MLRSAAGMVFSGLGDSPEVTATTSTPTNESRPRITPIQIPCRPCGAKPPGRA